MSLLAHAVSMALLALPPLMRVALPPSPDPLPSAETAYAVFLPAPSETAVQPRQRQKPVTVVAAPPAPSASSPKALELPQESLPEETALPEQVEEQVEERAAPSKPAVETSLPPIESLPSLPMSAYRSGDLTSPPPLSRSMSDRGSLSGVSSALPAPEGAEEQAAESDPIGEALQQIAQTVGGKEASPADIVFLLDLSGSMDNNIRAVKEHLAAMAQALRKRKVDATFGVVKFKTAKFVVFPQSTDIARFERLLANVKVGGNEKALTALHNSMIKVKFRENVERRFILITDEPFEGEPAFAELLPALMRRGIVVDVIGLDIPQHRLLARGTGGLWRLIPGGG